MAKNKDPVIEIIKERNRLGLPFDPYALGNVVVEKTIGNTKCYICDDCCRNKSREQVDEILKRCGRIATESRLNQSENKAL